MLYEHCVLLFKRYQAFENQSNPAAGVESEENLTKEIGGGGGCILSEYKRIVRVF